MKERRKILVIDDDLTMVKVLEKRLKVDGYDVINSQRGIEGVNMAKTEDPTLIVLDLMIPDISGVEVARRLKSDARLKDIPIVFISVTLGVENDRGDEEIDIDGSMHRIFAKPIHNRKFLSTIRKTINVYENSN